MASSNSSKKISGKTLADFRSTHDPDVVIPAKIKKALASMESEHPENWEYEADFLKRSGLSTTQLAHYRPQFDGHIVETTGRNPKKVWFASKKVAEKARGEN